jgi:tRNA A-37 threonylcarbamoyl transferase component Bud32
MQTTAFQLRVEAVQPHRETHTLIWDKILRQIPGKRRVCQAQYKDKKVIAKIYDSKLKGKWQSLREWRGLTLLKKRKLHTPQLLFYGLTEKGKWVTVTEFIEDSATALELCKQAQSAEQELQVLGLLFVELAKLNEAGVLQKDLHLGNFLISNNKVFPLDTAMMKFQSRPVNKEQSLKQLAILSCYVPQDLREELPRLLKSYADIRGWDITDEDKGAIEKYKEKHLSKEIKRQLKKSLRTSNRQIRIKENNFTAVFDRKFYENLDMPSFLSEIDKLTAGGQILKNGNTCFLSRVTINGQDVVIKHYKHKGLFHSIRQSLRTSRARRSWLHGHRLNMLGVKTPRPLAFIEKRVGAILWDSYILTEYVEGPNLYAFLENENLSDAEKQNAKQNIHELMSILHNSRTTHGDFKPTNFIAADDGIYVTDLDAMKIHIFEPLLGRRKMKDIGRLERMFA